MRHKYWVLNIHRHGLGVVCVESVPGQYPWLMLDLRFSYITCAAVVVTVYGPSNPRHEIILLQASPAEAIGVDASRLMNDVCTRKAPLPPAPTVI